MQPQRDHPDKRTKRHPAAKAPATPSQTKKAEDVASQRNREAERMPSKDLEPGQEREQRLRSLLDNTYQLVGLLTLDGTLIDANRSALKFSGIEPSTVLGRPFWEAPWWTHSSELQAWLRESIAKAAQGEFIRMEVTHRAADGSLHWIDFSLTPLRDESGKVAFLIPEGRDITDRKLVEEGLLQSKNTLLQEKSFLDAALNSLPGIFYVLDEEGKFVYWNNKLENVSRRSAEETARLSGIDNIADEDKQVVAEKLREVFTNGCAEVEANFLTADGQRIPYLLTGAKTVIGNRTYLAGMGIDVSKEKEAELARNKQEEESRDLYENAPCGYHSLDRDGLVLRMNNTELSWLGYSRDEVIGKKYYREFLPPESAVVFNAAFPELIRLGSVKDVEYRLRRKDGTSLKVLVNSSAMTDAAGRFVMSRATLIDITAREQVENERRLRLLLDSTGQAIYGIDTQGNCTFCNPACLRILGYDAPEELLGKNMHQMIHHSHAVGTPYAVESCRIFQAFRSNEGVHVDDEVFWRRDNTCFPVEYWSYPQKDGDVVAGGVVCFADITERKKAEAKLRKLTVAVEQSANAIVITDLKGNIEYVNPQFTRTTGYTFDEAVGKNPRVLKTGYTSKEEYQHLWETILAGHEWRGEFRNRKKNGDYYWERAVISPVSDSKGRITHFIAIKEDITDYKRAQDEARHIARVILRDGEIFL